MAEMTHRPDESPTFRAAHERIRTSLELIKKTQELLRNSQENVRRWLNNKTPEESDLNNSKHKKP